MKRHWSQSLVFVQMRLEPIIEDAVEHEQKKSSKRTLPADYGDSLAKRGSVRASASLFIVQETLCSVRYRTNFHWKVKPNLFLMSLSWFNLLLFRLPAFCLFLTEENFLNLTLSNKVDHIGWFWRENKWHSKMCSLPVSFLSSLPLSPLHIHLLYEHWN